MLWLAVIIISYFLFSLSSLGDRHLLTGPPNYKVYTFYVGILGILVLAFTPFVGFFVPSFYQLLLCLLAGAVFTLFTFSMFKGLEEFEASRIVPAFGGFLPIFTLALTLLFSSGEVSLEGWDILAFIILVLGSILITSSKKKISFSSLKIAVVAALLASLYFILAKYVFILLPFWTGFIWIRIGAFLVALLFVFSKDVRQLKNQPVFSYKTLFLFILVQTTGAGATILQNWAVALAGLAFLSVITALQGLQYFFLFFFSALLSWKYPDVLKEEVSKSIILRKALAVVLIAGALALLALK